MRRPLLLLIATLSIAITALAPAAAGTPPAGSHAFGHSLLQWQKRWVGWAFGSATNPLMNNICGEQVGRVFFLNAAIQPDTQFDCHLRPGTPLLGSPGGVVAWAPTDGQTRQQLLDSRDSFLSSSTDPTATLDGHPLRFDQTPALTDVYTIPLEPGNFIQTVDSAVTGDRTQVASGGWFLLIRPLPPGHHELVLADLLDGTPGAATFHITVGHCGRGHQGTAGEDNHG